MIFIEHIGRWIPAKWMDDVISIGQNIVLDLRKMNEDIYTHYRYKCKVFYDIFGWRSMKHNWIGYIEAPDGTTVASFSYSLPHKTKQIKIPMMGCVKPMPYPHKSEWKEFERYGNTVAELIEYYIRNKV